MKQSGHTTSSKQKKVKSTTAEYVVYIVRCCDDTLYTGSTNDMPQRLHAHNHTRSGAKYTRGRRPVALVYCESGLTLAAARAREAALKRMTRAEKERVVKEPRIKI
jgi:putative endonuclease